MIIADRAGQRNKISEGLEFFYQMANVPKPDNFNYLVKGWSELLKDIPIRDIERSFKDALKTSKQKIPSVYQVIEASKSINRSTIHNAMEEEMDQYKGLKPSDFPTQDQHKNAIRVVGAVLDGKCGVKEGKVWLEKISAGKIKSSVEQV